MKSNVLKSDKVFIVAEIGNNHEGSFKNALKLIHAAADSNVDAVKFQTMCPSNFISSSDQKRIDQLNKYQLEKEQIINLSEEARKLGLIFFSTPFDLDSADFLNQLQPIFKISSGDNNFHQLINKVFDFEKFTILSTGIAEIQNLDLIYKNWLQRDSMFKLAFLHCVSSYPVPHEQANLGTINFLKDRYPKAVIGYSDHTKGIDACCSAVSMGAKVIEKHFTLDNNFSDFRDHQLSSDPKEMSLLVNKIRRIEKMYGLEEKKLQNCEKENVISMRRSIAAARDIKINTPIKENDLTWLRPGNGFSPGQENLLIGKLAKKNILKGQIIKDDFLFL